MFYTEVQGEALPTKQSSVKLCEELAAGFEFRSSGGKLKMLLLC